MECNVAVQLQLMKILCEKKIDYFISLGDWYDRGYTSDVSASLADINLDIHMSNILKGNFYGLIGNHIRLNMDSNPELHAIQPHPVYMSRRKVVRKEQIIKTPSILRIADVQISFMHHQREAESANAYKPMREDWAKYHIALFHTHYVVPRSKIMGLNYFDSPTSNSEASKVLEDVDLAFVGDVHTPLGQFNIHTKSGTTIMVVPGSLTNVDASEANRHTSIMMPVVSINELSHVKIEYIPFDLLTNMLSFRTKNVSINNQKLNSLKGNAVKQLNETEEVATVLELKNSMYTSLNSFMREQRYSEMDKKLIRQVINAPEDIEALVKTYKESTSMQF